MFCNRRATFNHFGHKLKYTSCFSIQNEQLFFFSQINTTLQLLQTLMQVNRKSTLHYITSLSLNTDVVIALYSSLCMLVLSQEITCMNWMVLLWKVTLCYAYNETWHEGLKYLCMNMAHWKCSMSIIPLPLYIISCRRRVRKTFL